MLYIYMSTMLKYYKLEFYTTANRLDSFHYNLSELTFGHCVVHGKQELFPSRIPGHMWHRILNDIYCPYYFRNGISTRLARTVITDSNSDNLYHLVMKSRAGGFPPWLIRSHNLTNVGLDFSMLPRHNDATYHSFDIFHDFNRSVCAYSCIFFLIESIWYIIANSDLCLLWYFWIYKNSMIPQEMPKSGC